MAFDSYLLSLSELFPSALIVCIKATLLLTIVAIAALILRRQSAALRHLLWTFAVAGIVALPVLTVASPFQLRVLPAAIPRGESAAQSSSVRDPGDVTAVGDVDRNADKTGTAGSAPGDEMLSPNPPANPARDSGLSLNDDRGDAASLLFTVWLLGAMLLLIRFGVALVAVRRLVQRAAPVIDSAWITLATQSARAQGARAPVDIRVSEDVAMPFAFGLFAPTIVLPSSSAEWTLERREAVLMHEFAHISRGDLAMNTLSHLARAVYWFHPLAWLASYRLRVEGERACDDAVLRGGARPSDYAEHLLSIVRTVGKTVPSTALAMARRSDFEGRLLAILEPGLPRETLTRWRAAAIAALFLVAILPLAAASPTAKVGAMESTSSATVEAMESSPTPTFSALEPRQEAPVEPEQQRPVATTAVTALIETLSDANATVRLAAVNSLGALEDPRAIAALAKALKEDTDPRVREAAAGALGEIDDSRAVPHLIDALKTERVAVVREKIVRSLGEIDDSSAVAGIAAVVKDPNVAVRRAAAWALGELEDPSALPALMALVRDDDKEIRREVAEALGDLENAATMEALTALARDSDAEVRAAAVDGLGNLEDARTLTVLVAALADASPDVRSQAADAIQNIPDLGKAPPALIAALGDADREVRHAVAHALGDIGDVAAVPALKKATADSDVEVRRTAVESLSDIGGPEAITVLMALLKDPDPEVRRIAAEALGQRR